MSTLDPPPSLIGLPDAIRRAEICRRLLAGSLTTTTLYDGTNPTSWLTTIATAIRHCDSHRSADATSGNYLATLILSGDWDGAADTINATAAAAAKAGYTDVTAVAATADDPAVPFRSALSQLRAHLAESANRIAFGALIKVLHPDFAAQAIAEAVDSINVTAALAAVTAAERPSVLRILHQRARNSAPLLLAAITADSDSSLARHNADIRQAAEVFMYGAAYHHLPLRTVLSGMVVTTAAVCQLDGDLSTVPAFISGFLERGCDDLLSIAERQIVETAAPTTVSALCKSIRDLRRKYHAGDLGVIQSSVSLTAQLAILEANVADMSSRPRQTDRRNADRDRDRKPARWNKLFTPKVRAFTRGQKICYAVNQGMPCPKGDDCPFSHTKCARCGETSDGHLLLGPGGTTITCPVWRREYEARDRTLAATDTATAAAAGTIIIADLPLSVQTEVQALLQAHAARTTVHGMVAAVAFIADDAVIIGVPDATVQPAVFDAATIVLPPLSLMEPVTFGTAPDALPSSATVAAVFPDIDGPSEIDHLLPSGHNMHNQLDSFDPFDVQQLGINTTSTSPAAQGAHASVVTLERPVSVTNIDGDTPMSDTTAPPVITLPEMPLVASTVTPDDPYQILVDSGASKLMCHRRDWMVGITGHVTCRVRLGNGSVEQRRFAFGPVRIPTPTGDLEFAFGIFADGWPKTLLPRVPMMNEFGFRMITVQRTAGDPVRSTTLVTPAGARIAVRTSNDLEEIACSSPLSTFTAALSTNTTPCDRLWVDAGQEYVLAACYNVLQYRTRVQQRYDQAPPPLNDADIIAVSSAAIEVDNLIESLRSVMQLTPSPHHFLIAATADIPAPRSGHSRRLRFTDQHVIIVDSAMNDIETSTGAALTPSTILPITAMPSTGSPLNTRSAEDWRSILGYVSDRVVSRTLTAAGLPAPRVGTTPTRWTFSPVSAASRHVRHSIPHASASDKPTYVGQIVDTDLYPFPDRRTDNGNYVHGWKHAVLFYDRFSGWAQVYLLRSKTELLSRFREYVVYVIRHSRPVKLVPIGATEGSTVFPAIGPVARLHGDFDPQYRARDFIDGAAQLGVPVTLAPPGQHQRCLAEPIWRVLGEMACAFVLAAPTMDIRGLPYAILHAAYVYSIVGRAFRTIHNREPVSELMQLHPWGCHCYGPRPSRVKGDPRGIMYVWLGRCGRTGSHLVWNPYTNAITSSGDLRFDDDSALCNKLPIVLPAAAPDDPVPVRLAHPILKTNDDTPIIVPSKTSPPPAAPTTPMLPVTPATATTESTTAPSSDIDHDDFVGNIPDNSFEDHQGVRVGIDSRVRIFWPAENQSYDGTITDVDNSDDSFPGGDYSVCYDTGNETCTHPLSQVIPMKVTALAAPIGAVCPESWTAALRSPARAQWSQTRTAEVKNMAQLGMFSVRLRSSVPPGTTIYRGRWVLQIKSDGRLKIRWCALGFMGVPGSDVPSDTFSPVAAPLTVRLLTSVAAERDWDMCTTDVSNAFQRTRGRKPTWCEPPPGEPRTDPTTGEPLVWLLFNQLQGQNDSSLVFFETLRDDLLDLGFTQSVRDRALFISPDGSLLVLVYADDIIRYGNASPLRNKLNNLLATRYGGCQFDDAATLSSTYIGLHFARDRAAGTIDIDLCDYIDSMLDRFGYADCNPVATPMPPSTVLPTHSENSVGPIYAEICGSLLYLARLGRPDIQYAVQVLTRHMRTPGDVHLQAAHRVLRYLRGSRNYVLRYGANVDPSLTVDGDTSVSAPRSAFTGYVDAGYAGDDPVASRSVSGVMIKRWGGWIDSYAVLQKTTATSSVHSEFLALYHYCCSLIHVRELGAEAGINMSLPTPTYEDNAPSINWSNTRTVRNAQKHIRTKYFFVQDCCDGADADLQLIKIASSSQPSDILTKATSSVLLDRHLPVFGMVRRPSP